MTTQRDAIAKAVEALNLSRAQWKAMCREDMVDVIDEATDALRALPEQTASEDVEPVAWMHEKYGSLITNRSKMEAIETWKSVATSDPDDKSYAEEYTIPLYAHPSQPPTPPSSELVEAGDAMKQWLEITLQMDGEICPDCRYDWGKGHNAADYRLRHREAIAAWDTAKARTKSPNNA